MGAGRVLCEDVLRRRMLCTFSFIHGRLVGLSIRLGTLVPRQKKGILHKVLCASEGLCDHFVSVYI